MQGLSIRAYARHRGISHTAVQKAIRAGRIHQLPDGSIDPVAADREWDARTEQAKRPPPSPNDPRPSPHEADQYARWRALREQYRAELDGLTLQERSGELISAEEMASVQFALARDTLERLESIPDHYSERLAAITDPDEIHRQLTIAIRQAASEISAGAGRMSQEEHALSA